RRTDCPPASGPRRARASSGWQSGCAPASCGRTRSTASTRRARSAATRSPVSVVRAAGTGWSRTLPSTAAEVRPATVGDEAPLTALDLAPWSWLSSPLPPPGGGWTFFHDRRPVDEVLVAVVDGAIVGYVRVAPATSLEATSHVLQIRGITVDPAL